MTAPVDGSARVASIVTAGRTDSSAGATFVPGLLLAAGGCLAVAGNLLHPRFTQDDQVEVYRAVDLSDRLLSADLLLIASVLLVTAGLVDVSHRLAELGAPALGRLSAGASVVGGALAVLQFAVDGYALKQAAHIFVTAPDDANRFGAFYSTAAVDRVSAAMFSTWTLILLGLVPLLLASAMWSTGTFPRWLSVVGALGGSACAATAIVDIAREDQSTLTIVFLAGSLLVTVWIIATGVVLLRQKHQLPAAAD